MGISGNLKTMVLSELLQWLSMGQKTGTLVIDNKKIKKRIFFDDGLIISSASTDPKEYLGRFLVNQGFIEEELVDQAVARQKEEGQLLGKILVNMEAISEEDLHQILRLKAEESIYDVFTWEEGEFEFLDNELPDKTMIRMNLDVQWIVLEGSRRLDEWSRIREVVPSTMCVPVTVVDVETLEVEEVDRRILDWIDDDRTVEEISQEAQTSLFQVASTIADQVEAGTVKVVRPRIVEVEVPAAEGGGEAAPSEQAQQQQQQQLPMQMPMQAPQGMPYPQMQMPAYAHQQGYPQGMQQPPSGGQPGQGSGGSVDVGGRTLNFAAGQGGPAPQQPPQQPSQPSSEAEKLLRSADAALDSGDLETALQSYRQAEDAPGSNPSVERAVREGEEQIERALEREGVSPKAIPRLGCDMGELTKLKISPQEGFMLTRVDGSYDIKSILKITPVPKLDALMLFWRLKKSGHVRL